MWESITIQDPSFWLVDSSSPHAHPTSILIVFTNERTKTFLLSVRSKIETFFLSNFKQQKWDHNPKFNACCPMSWESFYRTNILLKSKHLVFHLEKCDWFVHGNMERYILCLPKYKSTMHINIVQTKGVKASYYNTSLLYCTMVFPIVLRGTNFVPFHFPL